MDFTDDWHYDWVCFINFSLKRRSDWREYVRSINVSPSHPVTSAGNTIQNERIAAARVTRTPQIPLSCHSQVLSIRLRRPPIVVQRPTQRAVSIVPIQLRLEGVDKAPNPLPEQHIIQQHLCALDSGLQQHDVPIRREELCQRRAHRGSVVPQPLELQLEETRIEGLFAAASIVFHDGAASTQLHLHVWRKVLGRELE